MYFCTHFHAGCRKTTRFLELPDSEAIVNQATEGRMGVYSASPLHFKCLHCTTSPFGKNLHYLSNERNLKRISALTTKSKKQQHLQHWTHRSSARGNGPWAGRVPRVPPVTPVCLPCHSCFYMNCCDLGVFLMIWYDLVSWFWSVGMLNFSM